MYHNNRIVLLIYRLDEREVCLETRKQAERLLQKNREKEKARTSRINNAASRVCAITSAKENWTRLKSNHKRLLNVRQGNHYHRYMSLTLSLLIHYSH